MPWRGHHGIKDGAQANDSFQEACLTQEGGSINSKLSDFDREHLTASVIPAGRASDVAADATSALWALSQLRRLPAIGRLARAEAHF
jgi:hypothetical protein